MKRTIPLYVLLLISIFLQISIPGCNQWFPDLVLLVVIFTSISRGILPGLRMGFTAGVLRGIFSVNMLAADILVFPAISVISVMVGKLLYRQNSIVQVLMAVICMCFMISAHSIYLNIAYSVDVELWPAILENWRVMASTCLLAPVLFYFLEYYYRYERVR